MKLDKVKIRTWLLVLAVVGVLGVYVWRLMNIQIVQADYYRQMLEGRSISTQTVKATRGEIVDRNGVPMASNRLGYDVVIDKAFFPTSQQNEILLKLMRLCESLGETWTDNLPISSSAPFQFLDGYDTDIARLRTYLEVGEYTSASDAMYWLIERYSLQDYTQEEARMIAGVRYEMDRRSFSIGVPYTFATNIEIASVVQIKERSYELLGVDVTESAIRQYDQGKVAPHLIGLTGPIYQEEYPELKELGYAMDDVVGKSGSELAFESQLRGENGQREIILDASGQVVTADETKAPVPGNTVMLTLDSNLQQVAQDALEAQIKYLQNNARPGEGQEADVGAVVALDPKTGQVLAAATYPSYDLNSYYQDYAQLSQDTELRPLLNRALQGTYAPGSTFKPVVATAGLAGGVIDEGSTVNCTYIYTRFTDYQPKCLYHHGPIALVHALNQSCNIFFYDVGYRTGIEAIDSTAKQYGLGEPTGLELYELSGQRSNPEQREIRGEVWNPGDVLQSSIGQLYHSYTPLQLANYTATIANRGDRMKVTIVKEIRDYSMQEVVQPFQAEVADRVDAPPEAFESIIKGMVSASRTGTARAHFANYPVDVASKTGTPEDLDYLTSTFICFAPADDPQIAIAVVIEKGYHGYTGAPVAKAILNEYFGYTELNPLLPHQATYPQQQTSQDESGPEAEESSGEAGEEIESAETGE